jgi:hypothetical protein
VLDFMQDKTVGDLPGVGYAAIRKLAEQNIATCLDLQNAARQQLQVLRLDFFDINSTSMANDVLIRPGSATR